MPGMPGITTAYTAKESLLVVVLVSNLAGALSEITILPFRFNNLTNPCFISLHLNKDLMNINLFIFCFCFSSSCLVVLCKPNLITN